MNKENKVETPNLGGGYTSISDCYNKYVGYTYVGKHCNLYFELMRIIILIALVYGLSFSSFSQSKGKMLQGKWGVVKIVNLKDGSAAKGKYGDTGSYLNFSFEKSKLSITTSPFDKGLPQPYKLNKDNEIELIFPIPIPSTAPEMVYKIASVTENTLNLRTLNYDLQEIEYVLEKLTNKPIQKKIEFEPVLIKRIIYRNTKDNFVYAYNFQTNTYLHQTPIYLNGPTLGTDLSVAVQYPDSFEKGKVSPELIVSLVIDEKGKIRSINKIQGVNPKIDESVIEFMNKSKWSPLEFNGISSDVELVFHFQFLLVDGKLY